MIAVLDDDALQRLMVRDALVAQGFEVEAFADGEAALTRLAHAAPQLIVSDVVMPGLDGLAFRRAYAARFPARRTPFLFLSSLGSEGDQVRGLEAGADDYLVKPVAAPLLVARVRACLRRVEAPAGGVLRGELDRLPFARVVEFCEAQGFTGQVEVLLDGRREAVAFRGGQLDHAGPERAALLDRLFGVQRGFFLVRPRVAEPEEAGAPGGPASSPRPADARPVGRLSVLTSGARRVQLQTEVAGGPRAAVVTVAMLEGRTIFKRSSAAAPGEAWALQRQVDAQHEAVEGEVAGRLGVPPPGAEPSRDARREALAEEGLAAFLAGDHGAALAAWEGAEGLAPGHRVVQDGLEVVRRALSAR